MTALKSVFDSHAALAAVAPAGLAVNIICQLVICRLSLTLGHVRRQFISFGFGLVATAAGLIGLLLHQQSRPADFAGYSGLYLLSYVFMGFCFFHVINLNISSLRIRMLKEYFLQDPNPLPESVLLQRYNVDAMLGARLERLQSGGQIHIAEGRYFSRPGGVLVVGQIFSLLRWLLLPR